MTAFSRSRAWVALALSVILSAVLLFACAPLPTLNAFVPEDGYRVMRGVPYAALPRQQLDIYVPREGIKPAKVMVFFYGGRWSFGDRGDYKFVGQALASRGIVTVIPDYRVYPEAMFPGFIEDGAQAVKWVQENIARYGGDPAQIYLMGHSAGAYIAVMLGLNDEYLRKAGAKPERIKGTVGLAGPYDFLPIKEGDIKPIFAVPDMAITQPVSFVKGRHAPMLLVHGEDDDTVYLRNSRSLAGKLEAAGNPVTLLTYPELGHYKILLEFAAPIPGKKGVLEEVLKFMGVK